MEITSRWQPGTETERELVLVELNSILSSTHFRGSKRYPALLQYVVSKTLDGHSKDLKERTLGVEVFNRKPDYDTNADPVVRFSASEIRKRIAQYYHANGSNSRLQIDLPLGSYIPEFKVRLPPSASNGHSTHELELAEPEVLTETRPALIPPALDGLEEAYKNRSRPALKAYLLWPAILLTSLAILGVYLLNRTSEHSLAEQMWRPLLNAPGPVLIVIGNGPTDPRSSSDPEAARLTHQGHGPYNHISICDAIALSRFTDLLGRHSKQYQIKEADLTSLKDTRDRSVILIGAFNNLWTMRLTEPLRFTFRKEGSLVRIADTQNPQNHEWAIDYTRPYSSIVSDYAVIARYTDPTTNGSVLIIAGIGAYGTEAASEFMVSPRYLEQLLNKSPSGWGNKNLEIVIKTDLINGEAGPPSIVASTTW